MKLPAPRFVLKLSCTDTIGIVAAVAGFLAQNGCTIVTSSQFGDRASDRFFMRIAFAPIDPDTDLGAIAAVFRSVAERYRMTWSLTEADARTRTLVMVSRFGHCLNDLLFRSSSGALPIDIVAIVSNHPDFAPLAANWGIPFHHLPVTRDSKAAQEAQVKAVVDETAAELIVLARYMQVLSDDLCRFLSGRAINIHHSFLPSFKGAAPYTQAHTRGVKLIGATAHYVTTELDEGPIIEQDVARVSHEDTPEDLAAIGRDVEAVVLARAVKVHVEHRVLLNGSRTVVFR